LAEHSTQIPRSPVGKVPNGLGSSLPPSKPAASALHAATQSKTKVWIADPDGHKWEVFVVIEADVKGELYAQAGCCGPELVALNDRSKKEPK